MKRATALLALAVVTAFIAVLINLYLPLLKPIVIAESPDGFGRPEAMSTASHPSLRINTTPPRQLPSKQLPTLSPLWARLLGTVVGDHPRDAKAYLEDTVEHEEVTVVIGDRFQGRIVAQIRRGFVILRRPDGGEELLTLDDTSHPDALVQTVGQDAYRVDRRRLAEAVHGDPIQLLTHATIVPHLQGFKLAGFQLAHVKPRSLAAQAGLKSGDVILAVNGTRLDAIQTALAMYHTVRRLPEVSLEVTREGESRTLRYVFH